MRDLALIASLFAASPAAAATPSHDPTIPAQFRGRWAESPRACRGTDQDHPVVTIARDGYSAPLMMDGTIIDVGPVRGGTHRFNVAAAIGRQEIDGVLTLRRTGTRLAMTLAVVGEAPVRHNLIRCR